VILGREMRPEQSDGREADVASCQQLEDDRKTPGGAGGLDAIQGLVVGEREELEAVREQRRVAGAQVHVAGVELGEVRDQDCRHPARPGGEALEPCDELDVREPSQGVEGLPSRSRRGVECQVRRVRQGRGIGRCGDRRGVAQVGLLT
jgi:hypothetical protein